MKVRRVVAGHDAAGKAVFVSDKEVAPVMSRGDREVHYLWGDDELTQLPNAGEQPKVEQLFPPVGGFRLVLFTDFPPGQGVSDPDALPGMGGIQFTGNVHYDHHEAGMHTTPTIDLEVVLQGEIVLGLDDGAEVVLRAGDTVVHHGERHRWENRGTEPARVASFLVGVPHKDFGR